jgi:hypothetical protein
MRIALVFLVAGLTSCAGVLLPAGSEREPRFRHRELGYEIAYPEVLGDPGWETGRLDEADLLVRHSDGALWALASTCRGTRAPLWVLAAELARATGGTPRGKSLQVLQSGLDGISQRLEREEGGQRLQIKTVTLRGARCTYDWVLIAPSEARLAALEPGFDRWWQSFEPGPTDRPDEAPSGDGE